LGIEYLPLLGCGFGVCSCSGPGGLKDAADTRN
jgi:hypothetical protein